jgi:hypothetical protein
MMSGAIDVVACDKREAFAQGSIGNGAIHSCFRGTTADCFASARNDGHYRRCKDSRPRRSGTRLPVNDIGALFEGCGETLECGIEHRSHQGRKHAALELIGDVKPDLAFSFGFGLEGPAIL